MNHRNISALLTVALTVTFNHPVALAQNVTTGTQDFRPTPASSEEYMIARPDVQSPSTDSTPVSQAIDQLDYATHDVVPVGMATAYDGVEYATAATEGQTGTCPEGTASCTVQNQHMGDIDNSSAADGTQSNSSNSGTSSVSNDSGMNNSGAYDNSSQNSSNTSGEINGNIDGTITGGNTESSSESSGNTTDVNNDNWANNEGNTSTNTNEIGQSNTGTVGDTSSNSGNNDLSNGVNIGDTSTSSGVDNSGNSSVGNTSATGGSADNSGNSSIGDTTAVGGGATVGDTNTQSSVGDTNASIGDGAGSSTIGDVGSTSGATSGSSSGVNVGDTSTASSANGTNTSENNNANSQGQTSSNANANTSNTGGNSLSNGSTSGSSSGGNTMRGGDTATSNSTQTSNQSRTSNDGSGNSAVQVDASNRSSYYSKTVLIPAIVPPTPPSVTSIGNIIKETTACGPLMAVERTPIAGTFHGIFVSKDVSQGYTYDIVPVVDSTGMPVTYREIPLSDGSTRLMGNQAVIMSTVVTVAGGRNLAIGGGGKEGDWGQGGMGSTGSNNRLVTNIQLIPCEIGTLRREVQYVEVPARQGRQ